MMLQMSSMMGGGGLGGGVPGSFPAPGLPSTAQQQQQNTPAQGTGTAGTGAAPIPPPLFNPWFPPPPPPAAAASGTASGGATPGAGGAGGSPQPNPLAGMFDPAAMQQMLGMLGGGGAGAGAPGLGAFGGLGGLGGLGGVPAAPADTRPPEERFQVQLQVGCSSAFFMCQKRLGLIHLGLLDSNCKTWVSRTRSRTSARCSPRAGTSTLPSSTF